MMVPENKDIIEMYHTLLQHNYNNRLHLLILADYACGITHGCNTQQVQQPHNQQQTQQQPDLQQQQQQQHEHHGTLVWCMHGQMFDQDMAVMKETARFMLLEDNNTSSNNNVSTVR